MAMAAGILASPASKLSRQLLPPASKYKFSKNIPLSHLADIDSAIRALTSLNLYENYIRAEGAKHTAAAIKVNVSTLRFD